MDLIPLCEPSGLLQKSMLALNKSYELLDFLKRFEAEEALRYGGGARGARNSYRKVDGLMELLQDRRRAVDQCMARQIHHQDVKNTISEWEKQEQEVSDLMEEYTRTNKTIYLLIYLFLQNVILKHEGECQIFLHG